MINGGLLEQLVSYQRVLVERIQPFMVAIMASVFQHGNGEQVQIFLVVMSLLVFWITKILQVATDKFMDVHAQVLELTGGASSVDLQSMVGAEAIGVSPAVVEKQTSLVLLAFADELLEFLDGFSLVGVEVQADDLLAVVNESHVHERCSRRVENTRYSTTRIVGRRRETARVLEGETEETLHGLVHREIVREGRPDNATAAITSGDDGRAVIKVAPRRCATSFRVPTVLHPVANVFQLVKEIVNAGPMCIFLGLTIDVREDAHIC